MIKKFITVIFLAIAYLSIQGQDIHFTQFYSMPVFLNPALTGHSNCRFRAGMLYRTQWQSINVPYTTQAAYVDGKFASKIMKKDWFGLGLMAYNDRSGDGNLMGTRIMLAGSYNKGIIKTNSFFTSMGMSVSYVNRSIGAGNLIFNNQWNGYDFDPNMPNNEILTRASMSYLDINAGILISYGSKFNPFIGISINHINNPKETFYGSNFKIGRRYTVHGGIVKAISEKVDIKSEFMANIQGTTNEAALGMNVSYKYYDIYMYIGVWSRLAKDIMPVAGLGLKTLKVLFSYDVNISSLVPATGFDGGFEISLTKTFLCGKKKKQGTKEAIKCPTFLD